MLKIHCFPIWTSHTTTYKTPTLGNSTNFHCIDPSIFSGSEGISYLAFLDSLKALDSSPEAFSHHYSQIFLISTPSTTPIWGKKCHPNPESILMFVLTASKLSKLRPDKMPHLCILSPLEILGTHYFFLQSFSSSVTLISISGGPNFLVTQR